MKKEFSRAFILPFFVEKLKPKAIKKIDNLKRPVAINF